MKKRSKKSLDERIKFIRSLRGSLKKKPGEKSMLEMLMEERRADREREQRELERFTTPSKNKGI